MNRLSNYFKSAQLAKMYLTNAEEHLRMLEHRGEMERLEAKTLRNLARATREMVTAMNNVASIAFHAKPKRKGGLQ